MFAFFKNIIGGYREISIFSGIALLVVFFEVLFWALLTQMLPGDMSERGQKLLSKELSAYIDANLSVIFFIAILCRFICQACHNYYMNFMSFEFLRRLRERLDELVITSSYVCLEKIGKARLLANSITNSAVLADTMVVNSLKLFSDALTLISVLIVMLFVSPSITISLLLAFGVLGGAIYFSLAGPVKRWSIKIVEFTTKLNQLGDYFLFAQREVRVNSLGSSALGSQKIVHKKISQIQTKIRFMQVLPRYAVEFLFFGAVAVSLYSVRNQQGVELDVEDLAMLSFFILCGMRIMPICNQMLICLNGMRAGKGVSIQILEDTGQMSEKEGQFAISRELPEKGTLIEMKGVRYGYNSESDVINNLNLTVRKSDVVLLEGKSGTGKSTALDLLLGLRSPGSGSVFVAKGVSTFFVSQHPFMPEGTVGDYFSMVAPEAKWSDVVSYMSEAGLDSALMEKDYYLGEGGGNLSGGQKQLFALIASILRGNELVVFDETTSGLDEESEKRFLVMVSKYLSGAGVVFISHKSAVKAVANKVVKFPL